MRCPVGSGALAALAVGTCIFQFGSNPCHAGDERHGPEEKCQEARLDCTAVSMPRRPWSPAQRRRFKVQRSRRIESCLKVNLSSLHLSTRRKEKKRKCHVDRTDRERRKSARPNANAIHFHFIKMQAKGSVSRCRSTRTINQSGSMLHPHSLTLRVAVGSCSDLNMSNLNCKKVTWVRVCHHGSFKRLFLVLKSTTHHETHTFL